MVFVRVLLKRLAGRKTLKALFFGLFSAGRFGGAGYFVAGRRVGAQ